MDKRLAHERKRLLFTIERILEGPMVLLGFLWLILLVIEFVWGLSKTLEYISYAIWGIFIIDFITKFLLAPTKRIFFRKNWLTAISLLIPAIRIVRVFRILRVVRGMRGVQVVRTVSSLNRSMNSLAATMQRRALGYVVLLTLIVTFGGAAAMHALEKNSGGFDTYGQALWWTAMRVITAGSEFFPVTPEGKVLAFLIAVFGYTVFGYVTATFATFFIGRDAEEKNAPLAGAKQLDDLKSAVQALAKELQDMKNKI